MKTITNYVLHLLLVSVLLLSFSSCENEAINEAPYQEGKVTIEYHKESQIGNATHGTHYLDLLADEDGKASTRDDDNGGGPVGPVGPVGPTDCGYEECDTAIPAMNAILRALANQYCRTVYGEVVCCMDDYVTYALMYADPTNPPCPNAPAKW